MLGLGMELEYERHRVVTSGLMPLCVCTVESDVCRHLNWPDEVG